MANNSGLCLQHVYDIKRLAFTDRFIVIFETATNKKKKKEYTDERILTQKHVII